jgi:hypothetical protein
VVEVIIFLIYVKEFKKTKWRMQMADANGSG